MLLLENGFLEIIYNLWKITEISVAEYYMYAPSGAEDYPVPHALQSDHLEVSVSVNFYLP